MSRVLLVDDDENFTLATVDIIRLLGHEAEIADSIAAGLAAIEQGDFDLLLLDVMLPDGNGFDILTRVRAQHLPARIAFITGHAGIVSLVKSVAGPNVQYLLKPIELESIRQLLEQEDATAPEQQQEMHFDALVGEDPQMLELYRMIEKVAATDANVLIQGESGTGKELVATAIHSASTYSGPFVAANCASLSKELLGSELFGHEKGAFTGAAGRRIGLFERANGGSLFLDEITEMPLDLQPALLRVLETGKLTRLGGAEEIAVNCRVISATNRSSRQLVQDKCLREDIYFRLAVFPLTIPPLRERSDDTQRLSEVFIAQFNRQYDRQFRLREADLQRLRDYPWPGNVRELRHTLYRAFILTDAAEHYIRLPDNLGSPFAGHDSSKQSASVQPGATIQEMERELIRVTLQDVDGDKPKAAEMLGISLKTLYNRLNEYGSNPP